MDKMEFDRKVNIAFVVNNLNPGGLEKVVIDLINHLDTNFFKIFLICLDGKGGLFSLINLPKKQCLILDKNTRLNLSFIWKINRFIVKNRIQILHAHNLAPLIFSGLARFIAPPKKRPIVIFSEHNQVFRLNQFYRFKFRCIYIRFANYIVTCSNHLKDYYLNCLGIRRNINVVHNGINGNEFRKKSSKKIKNNDKFVVGTAVVISEQKGLKYCIKAAVDVCTKTDNIIFLIAGDGPLKNEIEESIKRNQLEDKVFLLGYQKNIPELISNFDVYILPSLWEGLPLSLLEALCIGKPIIATDVGGNSEIVEHGINGLLIPHSDVQAISDAIMDIYCGKYCTEKINKLNRKKFDECFSLDAMVERHSFLYLNCMKKNYENYGKSKAKSRTFSNIS